MSCLRKSLLVAATLLACSMPARGQVDAAALPDGQAPRVSVSVRMMSADEIDRIYDLGRLSSGAGGQPMDRRRLPAPGAGGVFVGPPALFAGVRGGGVTAAVVGPPHSMDFQARSDIVRQALLDGAFAETLGDALRRSAMAARYADAPPESASVAVAFFGLRTQDDRPSTLDLQDSFCFVATGYAFAVARGAAAPEQDFNLGVSERSPGMAEPLCASFDAWSERGAFRLRQAMQESAHNIARWLVSEVLGGR